MYARPELNGAHAELWEHMRTGLRERGLDAPHSLSSGEDLAFWRRNDLLFSQTCGMPLREHLHADVAYVTTPDYELPDCPAGYYNSIFIAREAGKLHDFSGAKFALNGTNSQSGFAGPVNAAKTVGVSFAKGLISGGHRKSFLAVQDGRADLAAIDAMTWHYIKQFENPTVHIVGRTEPTPTLPYICSKTVAPWDVRAALAGALEALSTDHRQLLCIKGLVDVPLADYLAVETPAVPFPLETL